MMLPLLSRRLPGGEEVEVADAADASGARKKKKKKSPSKEAEDIFSTAKDVEFLCFGFHCFCKCRYKGFYFRCRPKVLVSIF